MREKLYSGYPSNLKQWFQNTFNEVPTWLDQAIDISRQVSSIEIMFSFKDFYEMISNRT